MVTRTYTVNDFVMDWEKQQVICPQGKVVPYWAERIGRHGKPFITVAAALNLDRIVAWLHGLPRASTSTSRFAALAPA